MKPTLNLLVIEDSEADFLLVERNLKQHGVKAELHRVDNLPDLSAALERRPWDAILSDYHLPGMDFRTTLAFLQKEVPDVPIILVSGSIGEEEALDLLKRGLSDFVLKDRPTRLAGSLGHCLDMARIRKERKSAESALRESESRFATIFRASPLGIGLIRLEDRAMVECNDALLAIFGLRREDLIGHTAAELHLFVVPGEIDLATRRISQGEQVDNLETQLRRPDGEIRDLQMSGSRIQVGGDWYLLAMVTDITRLKASEHSIQASQTRYQSLFENMAEGFAHCRLVEEEGQPLDWEYLAVNPAYGGVTGLKDVVGRRGSQVIPNLQTASADLVEQLGLVARGGDPAKFDYFLRGTGRWLSVSAYQPAPGEFVVMLENISERKLAEDSLRASEARFQAVFRASSGAIILSRLSDGRIFDANPAFLDLLGYRLEEVVGRTSFDLDLWVEPQDRENAMRELRATGHLKPMDLHLWTADRKMIKVTLSSELVEVGGELIQVNQLQDQTERLKAEVERRRMEAEVAHAQKLDSLGALAGGVSHDMNNVLAAIMALGSMLRETHKDDAVLSKAMDTLLHAASRGRDLVRGLTDFARKELPEAYPLELNSVVRKEADLLSRTTLQRVGVDLDLAAALPLVLGDPSSISNALMNLCVNALDAMPAGGRIRLASRVALDGQVQLSVQDTGHGMPPEVLRRALEPFFTTKPMGKGTGLGLALVYGVMKSHGGRVEIRSEPGKGTEVTLSFPPWSEDQVSSVSTVTPEGGASRPLRILLVDDDDLIRNTVPAMLETLGHQVVAFAGGLEAIHRLESGLAPDLVILDLSMPGMDGEQTLLRLRLLRPELPVLLASGYQDERHQRILDQFPEVQAIMKPFTLQDLRAKLARMG